MFAQKVEKSLVVARLHVEQPCHDLVVAPGLLKTLANKVPDVAARDLAPLSPVSAYEPDCGY